MRRGVGTVVIAELAVITFFFHLFVVMWLEFRYVAFMLINPVKQGVKRGAEVKAPPAPVTDVIDSDRLLFELRTIPTRGDEIKPLHD